LTPLKYNLVLSFPPCCPQLGILPSSPEPVRFSALDCFLVVFGRCSPTLHGGEGGTAASPLSPRHASRRAPCNCVRQRARWSGSSAPGGATSAPSSKPEERGWRGGVEAGGTLPKIRRCARAPPPARDLGRPAGKGAPPHAPVLMDPPPGGEIRRLLVSCARTAVRPLLRGPPISQHRGGGGEGRCEARRSAAGRGSGVGEREGGVGRRGPVQRVKRGR
jgi:hypothetical protein